MLSLSASLFLGWATSADAAEWSLQSTPNPTPQTKSGFEDVSCPTTLKCVAVGNDNYAGKGFVQTWDGSAWKLVSNLSGQVKEVSCPTTSFCVTVAKNENGAWRMNGLEWFGDELWVASSEAPAVPSGATNVRLLDVACTSEEACTAVGRYKAESGEWKSHAERWDGNSWILQPVPAPAGETRLPELTGVSCATATACVAVGSVESRPPGSTYRQVSMAARWDGSKWSAVSTPNPAGATSSALGSISCTSSSSCMALGTYDDGSGPRPFSERLSGATWTVVSTAAPANGKGSVQLHSVSCAATTACVAVGQYVSALGGPFSEEPTEEKTLVEVWNGSAWSEQSSPNPSGKSFNALAGVSCSSQAVCTAVGSSRPTSGEANEVTLGVRWNGEPWFLQSTPNPTPQKKSEFEDVSCPATSKCVAVGNDNYRGKGFFEVWDGSAWSLASSLSGQVKEISCPTTFFCVSIAKNENGAWRMNGLEWFGDELWIASSEAPAVPSGATNVRLLDVACTSEEACIAVGLYKSQTGEWKAHAERWDGTSWSAQAVPLPAGESRYPELAGVSCTSGTACVAVGNVESRPPGSTYRKVPMAARWDGSKWSAESIPAPTGAISSGLEDVSCATSSTCMALGTYDDGIDPRPFSERLSGGSWTVSSVAVPAGAKGGVQLHSLSCATATACVAVGQYVSALAGSFPEEPSEEKTLVEVWNGSAWSEQSSPNPTGKAFSALAGVSCSSQTVCTAVGSARPHSGEANEVTLGVRWYDTDSEAPDTSIATGPQGLITTAGSAFAFEATEINTSFECSLDSSEFTACASPKAYGSLADGPHLFRVRATDAFGNQDGSPAERAFEVDTQAPETTIDSPTPTYTASQEPTIEFSADESGSTYRCSFGGVEVANCQSPFQLRDRLTPGWHTFTVVATDPAGNADPTPAQWTFNTAIYPPAPSTSKLVYPEEGTKTASHYTLKAEWGSAPQGGGVTGVSFQVQLPGWDAFQTVPAACVVDGEGKQVSWPLPVTGNPGQTKDVFLEVEGCAPFQNAGYADGEVKFRAVFDGGPQAAGASEAVGTEFLRKHNLSRVPTDARESVGPAAVDLVTGAFTVSRTDVSIPVPGTEANLEFTRTYDSTIANSLAGYSFALGGRWQPSTPAESGYEGEAWTRLEEKVIEATPAVYEEECWNEEGETVPCGTGCNPEFCEKWLVEEAQPEIRWMELLDNTGAGISFEISGGNYIAPDYAKELTLTRESPESITLSDPNGTHTTFIQEGPREYAPKTISFQATPKSVRMVYETVGGHEGLRLVRKIGPAPEGVTCGDWTSISMPGCRTLVFEYLPSNTWGDAVYPSSYVNLASIRYYNASGIPGTSQKVAEYNYDGDLRLTEAWDPRLPELREKYSYREGSHEGLMTSLTPTGEEPWKFDYYYGSLTQPSKLKSVSRASLVSSQPTATTTIVYDVPVSGEGAPYDMSSTRVAEWGQSDSPVDATAVFPPTQVPSVDSIAHEASVGSQGSGNGELNSPRALAVDGAGNVWVADTGNNRIQKFNSKGEYLSQFGSLGSSSGQLSSPRAIAFDGSGDVLVADTGNNRIQKFSPKGNHLATIGSFGTEPGKLKAPSGIAVDAEGNIWVADTGNNRVQVFSATGEYVATHGNFNGPTGLLVRGSQIFVADTGNNRIVHLVKTSTSVVRFQFGSFGSGDGQFDHPEGLTIDGSDNLWVADTGNNRVQRLSLNGKYLGEAGGQDSPTGVAAHATNFLWIADTEDGSIEKWISGAAAIDDYTKAAVHYMDPEGYLVNTASAAPPGVAGSAITTSETDHRGNVVRSLSAQNRLLALEAADSAARARELDSHSVYSADGTKMLESWGPLHEVRLESGETVEARQHTVVNYDEGAPPLKEGETAPRLPTKEITGAAVAGRSSDADQRVTATLYNWPLRKPTETVVDPGGLSIRSITAYDGATGLPVEMRQPSNPGGGGPGTTRVVYYSDAPNSEHARCGQMPQYAGLPCKVLPAAQPETAGQPQLPVKTFWTYNFLDQPTEIRESPGGGSEHLRKTFSGYDVAGRPIAQTIEGGGQEVPMVETLYSPTNGRPVRHKFICVESCTGFDNQAAVTTYDALGRVKSYEDADGGLARTFYDASGRPHSTMLQKGGEWKWSQVTRYDEASGVPVELEGVNADTWPDADIWTGRYDADGTLVEQDLPNGLTASTTYNEAGEPVHLSYTKESHCGESCTWLEFGLERAINGQILSEAGTLGTDRYAYDKAGRLVTAEETPAGGSCTTRAYTYDVNSNRKSLTTRSPGLGGVCSNSGGTTRNYSHDAADRLLAPGLTYDNFGRITKLPGSLAGGGELTTSYFSTDMVATQSQGGVTNTFELDASLRQRVRLQAGGLEGTEVFHYAGPSDSPAWTERGSNWTLNISGLGGELAAIYDSDTDATTFQLTNLHGDVVATASGDPEATSLEGTFHHDEFGVPVSGEAGRFGWLGGKQRRTELPSGVIQMGVRSYVPSIGRFLTPDPVLGGAANPYDYANQDPVNAFDLEGTCSTKKRCGKKQRRAAARVRRAIANVRALMREKRAEEGRRLGDVGPINIRLPWEKQVNETLNKAQSFLRGVDEATSCTEAGALAGGGAYLIEQRAKALAEAGKKIRWGLNKVGRRLGVLGVILTGAGIAGLC
jgi:RHS repeat-associated protein